MHALAVQGSAIVIKKAMAYSVCVVVYEKRYHNDKEILLAFLSEDLNLSQIRYCRLLRHSTN